LEGIPVRPLLKEILGGDPQRAYGRGKNLDEQSLVKEGREGKKNELWSSGFA